VVSSIGTLKGVRETEWLSPAAMIRNGGFKPPVRFMALSTRNPKLSHAVVLLEPLKH
jgi:hypothetical protein